MTSAECKALKARYREWALQNLQEDGKVIIEPDSEVSLGKGPGAFVHAWVWVSRYNLDYDDGGEEFNIEEEITP